MLALAGVTTALVMLRARHLLHRAVKEAGERASIARFLPAEIAPLVEEGNLEAWRRAGARRSPSCLSTFAARLRWPRTWTRPGCPVFISSFRRRVMEAAGSYGGVVDKFMGDGALLIFGVPEPKPDDARRDPVCPRDRLVERWNAKRRFVPTVRIVGLHTGEAFCGVLGAHERLEFTVLGDVVNVAARIEQATKRRRALVASEATVIRAGDPRQWQEVGREAPRGRSGAVVMLVPSDQAPRAAGFGKGG